MFFKNQKIIKSEPPRIEETLIDDWITTGETAEINLADKSFKWLGLIFALIVVIIGWRLIFLNVIKADYYQKAALANLGQEEKTPMPRGLFFDRNGKPLVENTPVFTAVLDVKDFINHPENQDLIIETVDKTFGLGRETILKQIESIDFNRQSGIVAIATDVSPEQLIAVESANLAAIRIKKNFKRHYLDGRVFSDLIGYTSLPNARDLNLYPDLLPEEFIGKTGLESFYENQLRGDPAIKLNWRSALGQIIEIQEKDAGKPGRDLYLTIDADFQNYFYERFRQGLAVLNRQIGVGLAINPQNGEVLAMINLPGFDNNIFNDSSKNKEKLDLLNSPLKPLFNRAVAGAYNPGSTIKPLVGVAALKEEVIGAKTEIFSPGYLEIPNPYDHDHPSRFLDWRYQGWVDLAMAIAKSSNVYFYGLGGGIPGNQTDVSIRGASRVSGLGIKRLRDWWDKFGLGKTTGIDLPGEIEGFLPTPEWKEKHTGQPWRLGDTYNISIGQGDLLVTPLQLLNYIAAIANGGKLYRPFTVKNLNEPKTIADLSDLNPEIQAVRKGMLDAVNKPYGTAYLLHDLPFATAAKTGSAQVKDNTQQNAFFVGYALADNPQIAILVLIENSKEGSLNAVPIAKDVLNWYYNNRVKVHKF